MFKMRLFCAAGMSTSLLTTNIRKAAAARGLEIDVEAFSISEIEQKLDGVQVVLIGPQAAYMKRKALAACEAHGGIPMDIIPMQIYGKMDGESVLDLALKLANK